MFGLFLHDPLIIVLVNYELQEWLGLNLTSKCARPVIYQVFHLDHRRIFSASLSFLLPFTSFASL